MPKSHAVVREDFLVIIKQWLPQSMAWKECIEGHYPTWDTAHKRAAELNGTDIEAYVQKNPTPMTEPTVEES